MGRKKITSLATALLAVDALSPEELSTLVDYVKSKTATPRKATIKRTVRKPSTLPIEDAEDLQPGAPA